MYIDLSGLCARCNLFPTEDIWNVDKAGLNYTMDTNFTISQKVLPICGRHKKRMTLLLFEIASGTDKFPHLFGRIANKLQCFKKNTCVKLGFYYASNMKSRLTYDYSDFLWISGTSRCFNCYNTKQESIFSCLNISSHGSGGCLPELTNYWDIFLHVNSTSHLHRLDSGIITMLKCCYRTLHHKFLDVLSAGENLFNIDKFIPMQ